MSETMIHRKTKIDPETTGANRVRPRASTPAEKRAHLVEMRRTARDILTGKLVVEVFSPRNRARYGRTFPMLVGLHQRIGGMRVGAPLGQRRRVIYLGAERESWTEQKQEMRQARTAERIRARRRTRRVA